MRLRCRLAVLLALLLLPVAVAQAAIPLQNPKGQPVDSSQGGTTQAGAATRFNIHIEFGGSEHIKDLTQQLPKGISPDAFAPTCPVETFLADGCPANTQIGITTVTLTIMGAVGGEEVSGRVYYTAPTPEDVYPGLGIVLDAPTGKTYQRGKTQVNPQLNVLETIIRDFPQTTGPPFNIPIRIDAIDIELFASFIKNPASCDTVATRFFVTSYEDPGTTSTAEAPFTPTGCASPPPPRCNGKLATKVGTGGRDVLRGTGRRDVILGLGGNDVLSGLGGNDVLCGGGGRDTLRGGGGRDLLLGGAGVDVLRGGQGVDVLRGGAGADDQRQ